MTHESEDFTMEDCEGPGWGWPLTFLLLGIVAVVALFVGLTIWWWLA